MKIKMMIVAFAVSIAMATHVSAQCGPCDAVNPCNSCNSCCAKPCDLFSGLKSLLQARPMGVACSPCDPVVACSPCDPVVACGPSVGACDPCDPCGNVGACDPCNSGFKFGGHGLFSRCGSCGPNACDPGCGPNACDPCGDFGSCDPCGPSACGSIDYCGPGPVASFLIKSRYGTKKLFRNLFGSLDCGSGCGACGSGCGTYDSACGACDPCGPQPCEMAAPPACSCCR